jgi:hypothetical protein
MAHEKVRRPQEFAFPKPDLACSRRALVLVRGPLRDRQRPPALACSRRPGPWQMASSQRSGGGALLPVRRPMPKRKQGRLLEVG